MCPGRGKARGEAAPDPAVLRLALLGASGRMGRHLDLLAGEAEDLDVVARVDLSGPDRLEDLEPGSIDVALEFTVGDAPVHLAMQISRIGCAWVSGTTGLSDASGEAMSEAAVHVPVLWAPNMSMGIALLTRLLAMASAMLPEDWQMELVETHHGAKVDAPSGTALALAEEWIRARGGEIRQGRSGRTGPRRQGEVGVHAVRLPEGVGEHRILLGSRTEAMELGHRLLDRAALAEGAIRAARWLAGKPAGLYTLEDWVGDRLQ